MSLTEVGPGRGYFFGRDQKYRYGNNKMLAFLRELSDLYSANNDGHPFGIGDLSLKNGGIPGSENGGTPYHTTHMDGWCVDLFIVGQEKRANSIANPGGEPKPTLKYTDTANYNFTCTCALMDIILELRSKYQMYEIIYEDANVRPEARLAKWRAEQERKARVEMEAMWAWSPDDAHRVPALRTAPNLSFAVRGM
jgi:hypothetical protein